MFKLLRFIGHKWYLLLLAAAAIIAQCYLQLMLPDYMGQIQTIVTSSTINGDTSRLVTDILIEGGWMILCSLGVVLLAFIQLFCASYLSAYTGKMLREEMFAKVNSISLTDYNTFGTATLITRTTNDIEQMKNFVFMCIRILIMSPTMMIIALIKTSELDADLLIVLAVALPVILLIMLVLLVVASPYFRKIQEKIDNLTVVLRENLTGIRVIRAYDQEQTETKKFTYANTDLTKTHIKVNRIMTFTNPVIQIIFNFCFLGIYALGLSFLDNVLIENQLLILDEIANIASVAQYSMQIMNSFVMFAAVFIFMPQAVASGKRILEVLNIDTNKDSEENLSNNANFGQYQETLNNLYKKEEKELKPYILEYEKKFKEKFNYQTAKYKRTIMNEKEAKTTGLDSIINNYDRIHSKYHLERKKVRTAFKESSIENDNQNESIIDRLKNSNLHGIIEFKDVSFAYPGSDTPCIEHVSFKTHPGKTTAIIGSTGSGKSTIINLIPRFYKVTSGEILIDGININEIPSNIVRDLLGFVPQTALLFKGTIRSNIKFGKKDATDEEINEALSVAQAENFVSKLPDGLDTFVSQSGKNFSGGQKQRLCIARALVRKPEFYVFDDSFSALDFKTDAKLRAALKNYTQNSSVIVVAQRVSSILDAENIIVLNEGKVVGEGTHNELIKSCAVYQDIVKSQLDSDEIEKTIKMGQEAVTEGGI